MDRVLPGEVGARAPGVVQRVVVERTARGDAGELEAAGNEHAAVRERRDGAAEPPDLAPLGESERRHDARASGNEAERDADDEERDPDEARDVLR